MGVKVGILGCGSITKSIGLGIGKKGFEWTIGVLEKDTIFPQQ